MKNILTKKNIVIKRKRVRFYPTKKSALLAITRLKGQGYKILPSLIRQHEKSKIPSHLKNSYGIMIIVES